VLLLVTYLLLLSPAIVPGVTEVIWPLAANAFLVATEPARRIPFDSAKWKEAAATHSSPELRRRMVHDLLNRNDLSGRTVAEVEELLGCQDSRSVFGGWDMVYWVGRREGLLVSSGEWLVLELDDQQRVSRYDLVDIPD